MSVSASKAIATEPAPEPSAPKLDLKQLADDQGSRAQLIEELVAEGVGRDHAWSVAEASIRRTKAARSGQPFYYADVEYEFEALCRGTGADPESVEEAKRRVRAAARETAEDHGCPIEEALFFCFHESLHLHNEILAARSAATAAAAGVQPH